MRSVYLNRSTGEKRDLIAFLQSLVLFKIEEEEEAAAATGLSALPGFSEPRRVARIAPKGFKICVQ
jgi:hypothetical protein